MPGGAAAAMAAIRKHHTGGRVPPSSAMAKSMRGSQLLAAAAAHHNDGETLDVSSYPVPREELLRNIKRFQARDKYCWQLPVAVVGFILWCIGLGVHSDIESSYTIESGCVMTLLTGFPTGASVTAAETACFDRRCVGLQTRFPRGRCCAMC